MASDANHFQRASPESQGISSAAVLEFVETLEQEMGEIHSLMLLRHGRVIAEGWWSPYEPPRRHLLFSLSKSFTSTAVGLAIAEGYFALDDLMLSFFPDEAPPVPTDFLKSMRVRHLLTMSTGHADDTWNHLLARSDGDWIRAFFEAPFAHQPGTQFLYNTGATYMLSAIVQRTAGFKVIDFLQPRLFTPLGIEHARWEESPQGINLGGIGLSLPTEGVARFAQLYLQKGLWNGQRILPEGWVEEATTLQISNGDMPDSDWTQGYGYQFWRCRHNAYRGDGVFGQFAVIMPEQDAVLVITAGVDVFEMQQPLNRLWEMLLPAMQPDALPENAAAQERLNAKLVSLKLPQVEGQSSSPNAAQISGRTYRLEANPLLIETIRLSFTESGCTVDFTTADSTESIPCGYNEWQAGEIRLLTREWLANATPCLTSGGWTTEDSFTMTVRLIETPFFQTFVFYISGDELLIETGVNVSLGSNERLLLTAYPA